MGEPKEIGNVVKKLANAAQCLVIFSLGSIRIYHSIFSLSQKIDNRVKISTDVKPLQIKT